MAIETEEQAQKYLKEVGKHLITLRHLSLDAGFNTHAAIWLTIEAAFLEGVDEIKTITDMMGMYLESKCCAMEKEFE